jgi:hypothetical protein
VNHAILDYHNNNLTFLDGEEKQWTMKGIPKAVSIRDISSLQLNNFFKKE